MTAKLMTWMISSWTHVNPLSTDSETGTVTTKAAKKKVYKSKLTYRHQWKSKYPWVHYDETEKGMFCQLCQEFGKPPANARGAWTTRGIADWNHGTDLLGLHNGSKWHKDAAIVARMAEQSVIELQRAAASRHINEKRANNRAILLKLLCSVYFLVKHRIPHTATFQDHLALQVANGDKVLEKHLAAGPGNAQYTSKFSVLSLIEAIATLVDEKLFDSLKKSPSWLTSVKTLARRKNFLFAACG